MSNEFLVSRNIDDAFHCIQKVFGSIKKQLEEQKEFYKGDYQLVERFTTCPVVGYFLDEEETIQEEDKEFIKEMMKNLEGFTN